MNAREGVEAPPIAAGPIAALSVVGGVILLWPLGVIFSALGWPYFHTWGLMHGSFVAAWPVMSMLLFAAIWVPLKRRANRGEA